MLAPSPIGNVALASNTTNQYIGIYNIEQSNIITGNENNANIGTKQSRAEHKRFKKGGTHEVQGEPVVSFEQQITMSQRKKGRERNRSF